MRCIHWCEAQHVYFHIYGAIWKCKVPSKKPLPWAIVKIIWKSWADLKKHFRHSGSCSGNWWRLLKVQTPEPKQTWSWGGDGWLLPLLLVLLLGQFAFPCLCISLGDHDSGVQLLQVAIEVQSVRLHAAQPREDLEERDALRKQIWKNSPVEIHNNFVF